MFTADDFKKLLDDATVVIDKSKKIISDFNAKDYPAVLQELAAFVSSLTGLFISPPECRVEDCDAFVQKHSVTSYDLRLKVTSARASGPTAAPQTAFSPADILSIVQLVDTILTLVQTIRNRRQHPIPPVVPPAA